MVRPRTRVIQLEGGHLPNPRTKRESWREKRKRQESNERNKELLVRTQKGTTSENNK